jgi:hypothetical protein
MLGAEKGPLLESQPGEDLIDPRRGERSDPLAEARLLDRIDLRYDGHAPPG